MNSNTKISNLFIMKFNNDYLSNHLCIDGTIVKENTMNLSNHLFIDKELFYETILKENIHIYKNEEYDPKYKKKNNIYIRLPYISLFEGITMNLSEENHITKYLFNELIIRDICSYMYIDSYEIINKLFK